jgi:hypothetical protein
MRLKKLLFGIAAIALLSIGSCKKDGGELSNSWTVGSNTFKAATVTANESTFNYSLVAKDGNTPGQHVLGFFFDGSETPNATTPKAGTYKVVSSATGPGQVSFAVDGSSPSDFHYSLGNDNILATVSIIDNKVHISMPNAWASGSGDSVQVSADIMQD